MRRMPSKNPSSSCNRILLISRKGSSAPSSPPGRPLTSGNPACLPRSRKLGVSLVHIWPLYILITSGFLSLLALITSSTLIHHSEILRLSTIQARTTQLLILCIQAILSARSDLPAHIASRTLSSPRLGFCTSTVHLTRHRPTHPSSRFFYLSVRLAPPRVPVRNRTSSI